MNTPHRPNPSERNERRAAELTELMAESLIRRDHETFHAARISFEALPNPPRGYAAIAQAIAHEARLQAAPAPPSRQVDLNRPRYRFPRVAGLFALCGALGAVLLYLGSGPGSWVAFGLGVLFLLLLPFVAWLPLSSPLCPHCGSPAQGGGEWARIFEGGVLPLYQCRVCTQEFYLFKGASLIEERKEADLVLRKKELKRRGSQWRRVWTLTTNPPQDP